MNSISSNQFNAKNIIVGALEQKVAQTGDAYQSASLQYQFDERVGRLAITSLEQNEKYGGSIVFTNCKVMKIMKFGNKDIWTGDWQMVIPLYQNPLAPSKEELKFVDNLAKLRRKIAIDLVCENGEDATPKEIEKALESVKDPIFWFMEYAKDSAGKPILTKANKKKVIGVDKNKSPCLFVKLYNKRTDDEKGKAGIKTKFLDSQYQPIVPETLEGKEIDCVVEIRFDSIYSGAKGFSIQMKVSEVGIIRARDKPTKKNTRMDGFMKFIKPETIRPVKNDDDEYEEYEDDE